MSSRSASRERGEPAAAILAQSDVFHDSKERSRSPKRSRSPNKGGRRRSASPQRGRSPARAREPCADFRRGMCKYGNGCKYSHDGPGGGGGNRYGPGGGGGGDRYGGGGGGGGDRYGPGMRGPGRGLSPPRRAPEPVPPLPTPVIDRDATCPILVRLFWR